MTAAPRQSEAEKTFERASVADAMSPGVIACAPETPLREVAQRMAKHGVHALFVLEHGAEATSLWGLVSDLDLVAAASGDLDLATARHAAVTPLLTVRADARLEDAAQQMAETGVSHLAVLDPFTGQPAGVLSTLDVVRFVAHDKREGGAQCRPST